MGIKRIISATLCVCLAVGIMIFAVSCKNNDNSIQKFTDPPTNQPTEAPTDEPTETPTDEPTETPTDEPTEEPVNIFSTLKYYAIGDSLTRGVNSMTGNRLNPTYVDGVKNILGLSLAENHGIGSSTVADGYLPMYQRYMIISSDADIISVMGGYNDYGNAFCDLGTIDDADGTTFYGGYNVLVSSLLRRYPDAFVFLIVPNMCSHYDGRVNGYGYSFEDYATAIREIGEKYNIPVLDLYSVEEIYNDTLREGSDGVHHSQEITNAVVAPMIAQFIKDNYKP